MDQHISNELPPLYTPEQTPNRSPDAQGASLNEAQLARAIEQGVPQAQVTALPQAQPAPQIPVPAAAMPTIQNTPSTSHMPQIADDTDLIEKEWVLKAKEIVARTKHDPYEQNKQVEQMKVDYMKKRYNKDIKLTEQ